MKKQAIDFIEILKKSGVPTTKEEFEVELKKEVQAAGSKISNDSKMSPFWKWVSSVVIAPCVWLIRVLLAKHVVPNMFVFTAERWALELKAWELNIEPKTAKKTVGNITFTKEKENLAVTIKAGTVIQTLPIEDKTYCVEVIRDTVISAGEISKEIQVQAQSSGSAYNLPAGYFNILQAELPGIISVENQVDWIVSLGADEESNEELALRIQNAFTSAGTWHIDDVYRSMISSVAGIRSDNIYFKNTGDVTPGTAEAYILMPVGLTPIKIINQLNAYISEDGHHGHGDVLTCKAIPSKFFDMKADVVLDKNIITQEQKDEELKKIEICIRAAFRETAAYQALTRAKPHSRFSISLLETEIHNNISSVDSIKIFVNDELQKDIVSTLSQPRIKTLVVREFKDE